MRPFGVAMRTARFPRRGEQPGRKKRSLASKAWIPAGSEQFPMGPSPPGPWCRAAAGGLKSGGQQGQGAGARPCIILNFSPLPFLQDCSDLVSGVMFSGTMPSEPCFIRRVSPALC